MARKRILFFVFMLLLQLSLQGCAQSYEGEGVKLPGKIVFTTNRYNPKDYFDICTLIDGKVKKIYENAGYPKWSQDGKWVLCLNTGANLVGIEGFDGLIIVDEKGENVRKIPLKGFPFRAQWGIDSEEVFYVPNSNDREKFKNIFRYDLKTNQEEQVTFFNDDLSIANFKISPDGKLILFKRSERGKFDGKEEIGILHLETKEIKKLDIEGSIRIWMKDGKSFLYYKWPREGIWRYYLDTGKEEMVFEFDQRLIGFNFALSPDGSQVLFDNFASGGQGLFVVNMDGTGLKPVLPRRPGKDTFDQYPDWHE